MANVATITPLNQFFDTNGSPLNSGYLYFGSVDQDPEQFPVQMYWDAAGTIPALQPIRTISGYPSRAGSPAIIYGPESYSLRVKNSASVQVLYAPNLGGVATSASLTASNGSSLVGFIAAGAGAVVRTVQSKLRDFVSVFDYMTTTQIADVQAGTGAIDVTAAIQAALNASLKVYFPPGRYLVSATLVAQPQSSLIGAGANNTILQRTANYGDTLQIGTISSGAGNFEISGLWFYKPQVYVAGTTVTITYPVAADASHIVAIGAQRAKITDCFFWNMPHCIILENSTLVWIQRNNFQGIWDHLIAGLQEGLDCVYLRSNGTNFNVLITICENYFTGGFFSVSRNITVGTTTFSTNEQIGPRWGIRVEACEGLHIYDNYIGGQNDYCILLNPKQILASVKITGNFFDSGLVGGIQASTTGAAFYVTGLHIVANNFNGQLVGLEALRIEYPASFTSVVGLILADNRIENYLKTPVVLIGVTGAEITNNIISNYHARAGGAGDPDFSAGIRVFVGARYVFSTLNVYGGGVNNLIAGNNCQWGIFFNNATLGNAVNERVISLGLAGGSLVAGGFWQNNKRIAVHTIAGNYTVSGAEDIVVINKTVGAATQIIPPTTVDPGYTLTFKDGKGDAAANNIQFVGTVDGVLNPAYNTNFFSKVVVWNGTQWNVIG